MGYLSKVFVIGGLVVMTGPLSLMARAQSYIDVEAERAAQRTGSEAAGEDTRAPYSTNSSATGSPSGSQPAQSYPATSYGLNSAPAAPVSSAPVATGAGGGVGAGGQNLGNLFYQIQQLQQEVMRLNGKVEEQANELRKVKEQSLERYVDLDKRLSGAVATTAAPTTPSASTAPSGATAIAGSSAAEQPGEGESYRAAYALVRGQQFNDAIAAFQKFLRDYPDGRYAANAHYWLGELFLVVQPQDLEASRQSFTLLLDQYPDNNKAPDAMYKLGKVYFLKGNRERSREYMDRVISDYGSSGSSAVKLARDFITENY